MKPAISAATAPREKIRVVDQSSDKKYFTIVPRIVWALARTPYDVVFWSVVKEIAGDEGECMVARDDLAKLAMMSSGKVTDCRDFWIGHGLLKGELLRDPGYPQPVWHLTVPDLWERNIDFVRENELVKIKGRIKYKSLQLLNMKKEPSPGDVKEPSPGDGGLSPGDGGVTSGDGGLSPGDVNKIVRENQYRTNGRDEKTRAVSFVPLLDQKTAATRTERFIARQKEVYLEVVGHAPARPIAGVIEQYLLEFFVEQNNEFYHSDGEIESAYRAYLKDPGSRDFYKDQDWPIKYFLENFSKYLKRANGSIELQREPGKI